MKNYYLTGTNLTSYRRPTKEKIFALLNGVRAVPGGRL